jgi:hypothetical protein
VDSDGFLHRSSVTKKPPIVRKSFL